MFEFLKKKPAVPGPPDPKILAEVRRYIALHYQPEEKTFLICGQAVQTAEAELAAKLREDSKPMAFAPLSDDDLDVFDGTDGCDESVDYELIDYEPSTPSFSKSSKESAPAPKNVKYKVAAPSYKKTAKKDVLEKTSFQSAAGSAPAAAPAHQEVERYLKQLDAGFSETLLKLIDRSGEKDSDVYKRAYVDRRLFSKIRSSPDYKPSKSTALAFAMALHLDLEETNDLIGRAGYVLSRSSMADLIARYFITHKIYDIGVLNEVLYSYDLPLVGGA